MYVRRLQNACKTVHLQWRLPVRSIETIFAGIWGSRAYARLDLRDAYWQMKFHTRSREICTIKTSKGLFQVLRLPKGNKNSSVIFQLVMEAFLKDIRGTLIVFWCTPHSSDIPAKQLTAKPAGREERDGEPSKVDLLHKRMKFLGHLISADGIRPYLEIAKSILHCPSSSQIQGRLGVFSRTGQFLISWFQTF